MGSNLTQNICSTFFSFWKTFPCFCLFLSLPLLPSSLSLVFFSSFVFSPFMEAPPLLWKRRRPPTLLNGGGLTLRFLSISLFTYLLDHSRRPLSFSLSLYPLGHSYKAMPKGAHKVCEKERTLRRHSAPLLVLPLFNPLLRLGCPSSDWARYRSISSALHPSCIGFSVPLGCHRLHSPPCFLRSVGARLCLLTIHGLGSAIATVVSSSYLSFCFTFLF